MNAVVLIDDGMSPMIARPVPSLIAFAARSLAIVFTGIVPAIFCGGAAADELVRLKPDEAAIIFIVAGQGRSGDLEVRDSEHGSPVWATLLSQASVRQFTVRPGAYSLVLSSTEKPLALAAVAGHATVVSLGSGDGAYRRLAQSEVAPEEIARTTLPSFIDEHRIAESGYAPTSLYDRGAGLSFVFRPDF